MRIAIVSQPFDTVAPPTSNSVGLVTHHLATNLAERDEVTVYASLAAPGNRTAWDRPPDVDYRLLPAVTRDQLVARAWPIAAAVGGAARHGLRPPVSSSAAAVRGYGDAVAADLQQLRPDVVHVQHAASLLPPIRRVLPNAALVLHAHAEWFPQTPARPLARRLAAADLVVAVSDYVRHRIASSVRPVADRCVTVHNGVAMTAFDALPRPTVAAHARAPYLLTLGAVSPHKGVHDAIGAFRRLAPRWPTLELRIVGPSGAYPVEEVLPLDDRERVRQLRHPGGRRYERSLHGLIPDELRPRVTFAGRLPRQQVLEHLRDATVMVFPSTWDEGFGLPALEAMAAGTAVVATRSGGVPEIVLDGETGRLVDKGNPAAIARAVGALLDDPVERARLGAAGRRRAESDFAWPVVVERLREAYDMALVP